jgi:hypothetical protein
MEVVIGRIDIYKLLYLIEPNTAAKFRNRHHDHEDCSGHKHNTSKDYLVSYRPDMTELETIVAEVTSRSNLYRLLGRFVEETSKIFENIKQKGIRDGLVLDLETEKEVLGKVIEEAIMQFLTREVNALHRTEEKTVSRQPLLLAHPSGYTGTANSDLEALDGDLIRGLMSTDWGFHPHFLG